jgi:HD-like signal output (HDOD) protein/CheY-like chemotaxis protein
MKQILFVDDEQSVLRSLKRTFRSTPYELKFASSGEEALQQLEGIDMVISDIRMPCMDGFELLKQVYSVDRSIMRLVISGYNDHSSMISAVMSGSVHSYMPKPWDNDVLLHHVEHLFELQDVLKNKKINEIMRKGEVLPVLSQTYTTVMEMINSGKSISTISKVIEKSPQLVAKFLQVANSAFYGLNTADLSRALVFTGLDAIRDVLVLIELSGLLSDSDRVAQSLISHAAKTNTLFHLLYREICKKTLPTEISSAGLLHDVGCFFYLKKYGNSYREMLINDSCEIDLIEEEEKAFGIPHNVFTAYLLDWWNLPFGLVSLTLRHHRSLNRDDPDWLDVAVLKLADHYAGPKRSVMSSDEAEQLIVECGSCVERVTEIINSTEEE